MIVCSLLAAMSDSSFTESDKVDIFLQASDKGNTALMVACKNKKVSSEQILNAINELTDPTYIETVLMHLNDDDENILMIAAKEYPTLVPNLLHVINRLPVEKQVKMFSQRDKEDNNALLNACSNSAEAVVSILNALDKLEPSVINDILSHVNKKGETALTCLCRFNGAVVGNFLYVMRHLQLEKKQSILNHCDSNDSTVLILASIYQPGSVANLLEFIKIFTIDEQVRFLTHTDKNNWNALMHASKLQHASAVESLIQAALNLPGALVTLLMQTDEHKKTPKNSPVAEVLSNSSSIFKVISPPHSNVEMSTTEERLSI